MKNHDTDSIDKRILEAIEAFIVEHLHDPEFLYLGHYEYNYLVQHVQQLAFPGIESMKYARHVYQYEGMYVLEVDMMRHFNIA